MFVVLLRFISPSYGLTLIMLKGPPIGLSGVIANNLARLAKVSFEGIIVLEATNKTLMKTFKKKLEDKKGAWVEFHPQVL